jgi:hypothetical protein
VITYTFDAVTASWVEDAGVVTDDSSQLGDRFGASIAIAGDYMAVGAPGRRIDNAFDAAGSVSIFRWDSGTNAWVFVDRIVQPGGAEASARFGEAVDLTYEPSRGWTLIVGAPDAITFGEPSGAAFIFESENPGTFELPGLWTLATEFSITVEADWDIGQAVAISGPFAIVGEPRQSGLAGAAYILERAPEGTWPTEATFEFDPFQTGDQAGSSVDIDGSTAVIGVPGVRICTEPIVGGCAPNAETDGAVIVLERQVVQEQVTWVQTAELVADPPTLDATFGAAVSLSGERLLVGAPAITGVVGTAFISRLDRTPNGIWFTASKSDAPSALTGMPGYGAAVAIARPAMQGSAFSFAGWPSAEPSMTNLAGAVLAASDDAAPGNDCDGDGVDDECQRSADPAAYDCNGNGIFDACDIANMDSTDCDQDGIPDECQDDDALFTDCDGDGVYDACEIAAGTESDLNGNLIPDACELRTAEIVFILDTSSSQSNPPTAGFVCDTITGINGILAELASRNIRARPEILYITDSGGTPCDVDALPNFSCLTIGESVFSRFGSTVPDDSPLWPSLVSESCESWAAATAIVAANYPWRTNLRIIVPIGDECAWNGNACTTADRDAALAALEALLCRDVMAMPIQFDFNGTYIPEVAEQMTIIARGDPTPPSGLDPLPASGGEFFSYADAGLVSDFADAVEDRLDIHDNDGDLVLDVVQLAAGSSRDCNRNLIDDAFELRPDIQMSFAGMTIPELPAECEVPCTNGDVNGDFSVDFDDLLPVLSEWGPCLAPPCPTDLNSDDLVGFDDLLLVLGNWGWCAPPTSCLQVIGGRIAPPQSIHDCITKYGSDPEKLQKCIEAMILAETP